MGSCDNSTADSTDVMDCEWIIPKGELIDKVTHNNNNNNIEKIKKQLHRLFLLFIVVIIVVINDRFPHASSALRARYNRDKSLS